jgi:release factor glutamine methyltransferase
MSSAVVNTLRDAGCVFAEDEARLLTAQAQNADQLDAMVRRRAIGEPLEHILGWAEFCGLRIRVGAGVFVPRRRTEFLVARAAALLKPGATVVDLCCGSGAISAALAARIEPLDLHAVDVEPAAVGYAKQNIPTELGTVYQGDLYDPLPLRLQNRIAVIVANAPYVPTSQIELLPSEARVYEPQIALDGGGDGLEVQRRITAGASTWLEVGGHLLIETSKHQARSTAALAREHGLRPRIVTSPGLSATVVISQRRPD